ncbi:MAG: sugar ABC transporter permease, partial [Clostridia bacterium]|nr:sugar ABC transporter permease [Clostridia bacterium]
MVESKQQWKAWLYLAPAIVLLLFFTLWPIVNTVRMAFLENYSGLKAAGGATFSFGLGNFEKVIGYRRFVNCLKNTVILCVLTVPVSTILALLIAVALNSIKRFQKALQTIFFLPYVTNSIAIGMVFAAMFNIVGSFYGTENEIIVTAGIINNVIQFFGGEPVNWINYGST